MSRLDNIPLNVMGGDEETDTSPAKRQRTYEEMD
jgi:hypothetical protein